MDTQRIHAKPAGSPEEGLDEWVTPEIVERDIAEITKTTLGGIGTDGLSSYS